MTIAVLSSNFEATTKFLIENYNAIHIEGISRKFLRNSKNKNIEYCIIQTFEDGYAGQFDSYMIAPDYTTLEDIIKSRLKK